MSDYKFSPNERYAIYTVYGPNCYLCNKPLALKEMHVDHILPESLERRPDALASALDGLGLPEDFCLNDYGNWLPACQGCNSKKRAAVFEAVPIILLELCRAKKYADVARRLEYDLPSLKKFTKSLSLVLQAAAEIGLSDDDLSFIEEIGVRYKDHKTNVEMHKLRNPVDGVPERRTRSSSQMLLQLTPDCTILYESGGMRIVRGRYGVGGQPLDPNPPASYRCGNCGSVGPWHGAKCINCGCVDDGG